LFPTPETVLDLKSDQFSSIGMAFKRRPLTVAAEAYWALYPYGDLAVRTWAMRAAPSYEWPTDEAAFGRVWRTLAGDYLSVLTLFTLAWGSRHGDIA
jgi:DNA-3-methyladenine glycosylase II